MGEISDAAKTIAEKYEKKFHFYSRIEETQTNDDRSADRNPNEESKKKRARGSRPENYLPLASLDRPGSPKIRTNNDRLAPSACMDPARSNPEPRAPTPEPGTSL